MKKMIVLVLILAMLVGVVCAFTACGCNHEYGDWEYVKRETATEPGQMKHTCTKCGHTETKEIPPIGSMAIVPEVIY